MDQTPMPVTVLKVLFQKIEQAVSSLQDHPVQLTAQTGEERVQRLAQSLASSVPFQLVHYQKPYTTRVCTQPPPRPPPQVQTLPHGRRAFNAFSAGHLLSSHPSPPVYSFNHAIVLPFLASHAVPSARINPSTPYSLLSLTLSQPAALLDLWELLQGPPLPGCLP